MAIIFRQAVKSFPQHPSEAVSIFETTRIATALLPNVNVSCCQAEAVAGMHELILEQHRAVDLYHDRKVLCFVSGSAEPGVSTITKIVTGVRLEQNRLYLQPDVLDISGTLGTYCWLWSANSFWKHSLEVWVRDGWPCEN